MSDLPARSKAEVARLLVVDDNDDNRNLLSRRLRSKGYDVDIAEDGPSALEACNKNVYDAILLDVMMPGMSGIEVLDKLRLKHAKTELSVIMATAKNDSVSVVDALKRGANDYVTKPIDFPVLLARLETQLAMKAEAAERAATNVDVTFGIAPGTVLCNRYEIHEKLGEGGFAVVYRARQLSTNRDVALKHLRPDVIGASGDNVQIERFERESKLIGDLNHPNVVRLIDSGSVSVRSMAPPATKLERSAAGGAEAPEAEKATRNEDPTSTMSQTRRRSPEQEMLAVPYIVMDLLTGEPLSELIEREAPLEATRAIEIILPVLSALSAAHEKGVVHRDVKPSNIMITPDGRGGVEPKVLDFGIAKLTAREDRDLTVNASLLGTPQYMPPEQARGMKDLDGRTDQFAGAAVLYQMLTGKTLYSGEGLLELIIKVLAGSYTPLGEARPDLPAELVEVIARALSTEREDRYASMTAFGRALLPFAGERAARRWTDHFAHEPSLPPPAPAEEATTPLEPTEPLDAPGPKGSTLLSPIAPEPLKRTSGPPAGSTDATVALPGARREPTDPPRAPDTKVSGAGEVPSTQPSATDDDRAPPMAMAPTLESELPPGALRDRPAHAAAPAPAKMPWERAALIAIALGAVFYTLARYLF